MTPRAGADAGLERQVAGLGPLAVELWERAMEHALETEQYREGLKAAEAVMNRLLPVRTAEERSVTVHVTVSREERAAIEAVCREVGVELPALPGPDRAP